MNDVAPQPGKPSRRTVLVGAAWSVPVIAAAAAAPQVAASGDPKGSLRINTSSMWGGGGQSPQGNFTIISSSEIGGDTRQVTITPTAVLYRLVNGDWVEVGPLSITPASATVNVDGGSPRFNINESTIKLVSGATYRIAVTALGLITDNTTMTATKNFPDYTAW